jgi:cytochrome d ubiquinol oxidase subunit I
MVWSALLLSRLQFAFTVSFHIIFPSFTIGLAAWLTVLEALHMITAKPVYRRLLEFWLKIFGVTFGLGVVSGVVLAFEFGMNWSRLSEATGAIQGPLLTYESFTAFALEASFFGVLIFGRTRVSPAVYLFSTAMVALGTTFSAFWIMVNNSWMQAPVAMRSKMASSFQRIGRRSFLARSYGSDFHTCSSRPTWLARFVSLPPALGIGCAVHMPWKAC